MTLLPRWLHRWVLNRSLTRIAVELAAAREWLDTLDYEWSCHIDDRIVPPDALCDDRRETRDRIAALEEERDYVEGKLAAIP